MLEIETKNGFFLFQFDHPKADQTAFFEPEFWQKKNRTLGFAQGRGKTWFLETKDIFGINTALRHYYRGGLIGKINPDYYWQRKLHKTRSVAEFHLLNQLHQAGLPVPKPIGARVKKNRLGFYRADLLMELVENAEDLTVYLKKNTLSNMQWFQIGTLIRKLHNHQVCHSDLNAHNILLQQAEYGAKFWLLDFDKCHLKKGDRWKEANLQRLQRSFYKEVDRLEIHFNEDNWQTLMAGYRTSTTFVPLSIQENH
ncbi:3-deoxy-D-manno-octulosonic acid kinase [Pasteurella sp. PK-2025]|uniref:3-deoxy-D-manno-octulosonic acid kinase n=1 Tax=unclassified Pasteurella TaxID=2621516 RepID=UPI003C738C4A